MQIAPLEVIADRPTGGLQHSGLPADLPVPAQRPLIRLERTRRTVAGGDIAADRLARGEIFLMTEDHCVPDMDWVKKLCDALQPGRVYRTRCKACGSAIYDMEGLTFQGSLDDFWKAARSAVPDRGLYIRFRNYVIEHSQLNGNYYKRLKGTSLYTGIDWHNVRSIINRNEGGQVEGTHNGGRTGDQVLAAVSRALP